MYSSWIRFQLKGYPIIWLIVRGSRVGLNCFNIYYKIKYEKGLKIIATHKTDNHASNSKTVNSLIIVGDCCVKKE